MNDNICPQGDAHFAIWSERSAIADGLSSLGMHEMAKKAIAPSTSQELINKFLTIIEREARKLNRHDVIESLCFAGLVYG